MTKFSKLTVAALSFTLLTFISQGLKANDLADCLASGIPEYAVPSLHNAAPLKNITKNFSVSKSMNEHFNNQKSMLKILQNQTLNLNSIYKIRLAATGDIMRIPSEQKEYVDIRLKQYLETFDIVIGNLETLVSPNEKVPPNSIFKMNSDPSILTAFQSKDGSNIFTAVSMANNHTFDYSDTAIEDTLLYLNKLGIQQSGIHTSDKPYIVIEREGIRIGYYAITTFVNSSRNFKNTKIKFNPFLEGLVPMHGYKQWGKPCDLDYNHIQSTLTQMKADKVDFRIIGLHWGQEHDFYPQPKQLQIAREIMRLGWDVVIGTGTHSPQPAEICFFNGYEKNLKDADVVQSKNQCLLNTSDGVPRKSIVFYSLGNFTSYTPFFWQQLGTIAEIGIEKDRNGKIDWHSPKYTYTYDHTYNPPNGKQFLTFFDKKGIECPWDICMNQLEWFLSKPARHMESRGFTYYERVEHYVMNAIDSIRSYVGWSIYDDSNSK